MEDYTIRNANAKDIDFIAEAIIAAEKSGSDILSYTTIFGLSEEETFAYLKTMLEEEIDGCELSLSSYLIAEQNNKPIATMGVWVEEENPTSSSIKGSILGFVLPLDSILKAKKVSAIVSEMTIDYIPESLCIGIVYVAKEHRGKNLVSILLDSQIKKSIDQENIEDIYIQVFGNNTAAIKSYKKLGFKEFSMIESKNKEILKCLPSNKKYFLKKSI